MRESRFDILARRASVTLAQNTSRRDFLGLSLRGLIAAGIGTTALLGVRREAFAAAGCTQETGAGDNTCSASGVPGNPSNYCENGDNNGCTTFDSIDPRWEWEYCDMAEPPEGEEPSANCPCVAGDPNCQTGGSWVCCCSGRRHRCTDCYKKNLTTNEFYLWCIVHYQGGSC
jgi:hypothetical protein